MKLWLEYPESTRFARYPYDILYTPIFFANESISGHLCLEVNQPDAHEIPQLAAEVSLIGSASLGLMSLGGQPSNIYDLRYSGMVGFRPILSISVLDVHERLSLDAGQYDRGSVQGRRVPFSFNLPVHTLNRLREMTPSLKIISSDTDTTLDILKDHSPTMLINVRYKIEAVLSLGDVQKQKIEQEVRVWVALDELQVPSPLSELSDNVTQHRRMSLVPLKRTRALPFTSSRRKSVHEGNTHIIVEADDPDSFTFQPHNDAAVSKLKLRLTYSGNDSNEPPGPVQGNIEWLMKSLSTLAVQPNNRGEDGPAAEDFFHLRSRHMGTLKKLKLNWMEWDRPSSDEAVGNTWRSVTDLWLTLATTTGLTPTFRTSYLSHSYTMSLRIKLGGKGMNGRNHTIELNLPVKVTYDIGLAPSYEMDQELPSYEVDEGAGTQQPGPGPEHPYDDPPPPHEDADPHMHMQAPIPRYTRDELADLIRTTGIATNEEHSNGRPPAFDTA